VKVQSLTPSHTLGICCVTRGFLLGLQPCKPLPWSRAQGQGCDITSMFKVVMTSYFFSFVACHGFPSKAYVGKQIFFAPLLLDSFV